ncbi:hypothetical protein BT63DRAFT_416831 [Microthyrium microscopicum]|uniref:Uncharacterized protein n=1 Tax=Microthyrium microscopicum TaxID=703497 RepID=A0A6A6U495_9PEZI|nr:hypothetical protein BT63DRAFT_416831 [Microthyrium microscopicum]
MSDSDSQEEVEGMILHANHVAMQTYLAIVLNSSPKDDNATARHNLWTSLLHDLFPTFESYTIQSELRESGQFYDIRHLDATALQQIQERKLPDAIPVLAVWSLSDLHNQSFRSSLDRDGQHPIFVTDVCLEAMRIGPAFVKDADFLCVTHGVWTKFFRKEKATFSKLFQLEPTWHDVMDEQCVCVAHGSERSTFESLVQGVKFAAKSQEQFRAAFKTFVEN